MESFFAVNILDSIGDFITMAPVLGFIVLGISFIIRGELTILLSVYLVLNGYMNWGTLILLAFVSIIIGDNGMYLIGRLVRNTKLSLRIEKRHVFSKKFQMYFQRNFVKLIFLAKFAAGLTLAFMFSSGWSRINFKKFFLLHFFAIILWFLVMTSLSYGLIAGLGYLQAKEMLNRIEIGFLIVIVLILTGEYFIKRLIKRESDNIEQAEEKAPRLDQEHEERTS